MTFEGYTLDEILDDLSCRFLINVPSEELKEIERICFQVEQAHWFYEDFVREDRPELRTFQLKEFSAIFFKYSPILRQWANKHEVAYQNFLTYKFRIPVCGAILLNPALDKFVLVKGWKSSTWSFPRGKINHDESQLTCAAREVLEEIGYDVFDLISEADYIESKIQNKKIRLYIIPCVPEDTVFLTQTRKEISAIEWHSLQLFSPFKENLDHETINRLKLSQPKGPYYLVSSFMNKLANWLTNYHTSKKYYKHLEERAPGFVAKSPTSRNFVIGNKQNNPKKNKIHKKVAVNPMLDFTFDVDQIMNSMDRFFH